MHHRNNKYEIRFEGVKNSVRENVRKAAMNIIFDNSPTLRGFYNPPNCVFNDLDKS